MKPLRRDAFPSTLAIMNILSDGEWHDYETVMFVAMESIPPGMAYRASEQRKKFRNLSGRRTSVEKSDVIRFGQRHLAYRSLYSLKYANKVEIEYEPSSSKRPKAVKVRIKNEN